MGNIRPSFDCHRTNRFTMQKKGSTSFPALKWPALIRGSLRQRYKRFLADVTLPDGRQITAHCPNSGSMQGCCTPGRSVYLSHHPNPRRKLKYTWELIRMPDSLVGINTLIPNRLIEQSLRSGAIPELGGYATVNREVKISSRSRIDFVLERETEGRCIVEVKNCTLVEDGVAYFPDAVTQRGLKHLHELEALAASGNRSVMLYLIQRMDADLFRPAAHIDPAYTKALVKAHVAGVEILVYDVHITLKQIRLNRKLPFELPDG